MDNQVSTEALIAIAAVGGLGALLGAVVSSLLNIYVEKRRDQREQQTWARDQKWEAYTALMQSLRLFKAYYKSSGYTAEQRQAATDFGEAFERTVLIMDQSKKFNLDDLRQSYMDCLTAEPQDTKGVEQAQADIRQLLHDDLKHDWRDESKRSVKFGNKPPKKKEA